MKRFNFVKVLLVASALCVLPANGQGGMMGCLKKMICNLGPFINQCCSTSFENGTLAKQEMINCLKGVLMKEAQGCMGVQNPGTGGDGEVEGERYGIRSRNRRFPFQNQGMRSSLWGQRQSFPTSNKGFRSGNMFGNYGGSNIMQNEDCQFAKSNLPNGTEDCAAWSEAAGKCAKGIPMIKFFCQSGNSIIGQNPLSGMGSGGRGSLGGMSGNNFGFGGNSPYGTRPSFGRPGSVGVIGKPTFYEPGKRKAYTPNPGDEREYEAIPVSS